MMSKDLHIRSWRRPTGEERERHVARTLFLLPCHAHSPVLLPPQVVVLADPSTGSATSGKNLQIAALSEEDARHGELQSDPAPRIDQRLSYSFVKYVRFGASPQEVYAGLSTMWSSLPVLLQGGHASVFSSSCVDFDAVAEFVDSRRKAGVVTMVSDAKLHRFMEFDLSKNDAKGPYHVREFETQMIAMGSVREFVQCARSWQKQRVFLVLKAGEKDAADMDGTVKELVGRMLEWEALNGLLASQRFSVVERDVRVEMGTRNGVLPARYSTHDQLMVQICGRRRVTLVAPSQAFSCMYPYPTHHPYDLMAMASLETLNAEDWPGTKDARLHRAILAPGDALYVPAYWFVHVQELDEETVCVRVPLSNGVTSSTLSKQQQVSRRPPAGDATLLRVSRVLEDRIAQTVGVPHIKRWLRIISKNTETKFFDLSTVKGYKCARMTQDTRDDLACSDLPVEASCTLIIDRRLEPTPWLNANFREPLLLTDTPKVYQDTRTDEERKYPTLFRKKLERDGWTVQQTVSTVPIPGVNMPKDADYRFL